MNVDIIGMITVFVLAAFVGFEVISKVPSILHTPLMSGTNAVHGIILVGSMAVLSAAHGPLQAALGFVAVVLATLNVVGGFVVTDRMLEMFKGRSTGARQGPEDGAKAGGAGGPAARAGAGAAASAGAGAADAAKAGGKPITATGEAS